MRNFSPEPADPYNEAEHEPGFRAFKRAAWGTVAVMVAGGLAAFCTLSDGSDAEPSDSSTFEEQVGIEQDRLAENLVVGFAYESLRLKALYAKERYEYDYSPEALQACQDAVADLARASITGKASVDCTS